MKLNTKLLAEKLLERLENAPYSVLEVGAKEIVIEALDAQIELLAAEVMGHVDHLKHPEPRNKAEYDEKIGVDNED